MYYLMKLNGSARAAILGVALTAVIGWCVYITSIITALHIQYAVMEERLVGIDKQMTSLGERLASIPLLRYEGHDRNQP